MLKKISTAKILPGKHVRWDPYNRFPQVITDALLEESKRVLK
jgi:hypothetical protein